MATIKFLIILTTIISLFPYSNSQAIPTFRRCSNTDGNYTTNSTYQYNLKLLWDSLYSNASSNGSIDAVGVSPDRVHGLILCRGDLNVSECRSCLSQAPQDIQDKCPFRKTATIWYDNCLLRYSKQRLGWKSYADNNAFSLKNTYDLRSEWPRFKPSVVKLLTELTNYVALTKSAPPPPLFSTGQIQLDHVKFPMIYGLVQCTIDLSPDDCKTCLQLFAIPKLQDSGNNSIGCRVTGELCSFRYEVAPFYSIAPRLLLPTINTTSLLTPAQPPDPPAQHTNNTNTTTQGSKKNATTVILAITIPLGAVLVISLVGCILSCTLLPSRVDTW